MRVALLLKYYTHFSHLKFLTKPHESNIVNENVVHPPRASDITDNISTELKPNLNLRRSRREGERPRLPHVCRFVVEGGRVTARLQHVVEDIKVQEVVSGGVCVRSRQLESVRRTGDHAHKLDGRPGNTVEVGEMEVQASASRPGARAVDDVGQVGPAVADGVKGPLNCPAIKPIARLEVAGAVEEVDAGARSGRGDLANRVRLGYALRIELADERGRGCVEAGQETADHGACRRRSHVGQDPRCWEAGRGSWSGRHAVRWQHPLASRNAVREHRRVDGGRQALACCGER